MECSRILKAGRNGEDYFSLKGYNCIAPAWPLHDGEPAELRANPPEGLGDLQLQDILTEIKSVIAQSENPIVIGHSVGGLIVQLLINQGLASARCGYRFCSAQCYARF